MGEENNTTSNKSEEWVDKHLHAHLKDEQLEAPNGEKIEILKKRKRSRWWMLVINIAVILFFGYSFYFGITQLSDTFFYILLAVFVINMALIYYQTKQLKELIAYLKEQIPPADS